MRIELGNKYLLRSDSDCFWVSVKVKGDKAKEEYERRVSGYKATFSEAVESFVDRYATGSEAEDIKELRKEIEALKAEVRGWRDKDVHM